MILGGGYNAFVPKEQRMPMRDNIFEADEVFECYREDGVNLIDVWKGRHSNSSSRSEFLALKHKSARVGFSDIHPTM